MPRPKLPATPDAHDQAGELNVVPFLDILLNVLMFVLATIAVTFTTALDAAPVKRDGPRGLQGGGLALNVAVLRDGFLVSARGQRMGQGCETQGTGLAVGRTTDGERDYDGLTSCVRRLKAQVPEDRDVVITASNEIQYEAIVHTMDAVRGVGAGDELFPAVSFGVPR